MNLETLQHAADLISVSEPSKISGNENSILASKNLLNVVGSIEVLAKDLQSRGLKSTQEVFEKLDELEKPTDVESEG